MPLSAFSFRTGSLLLSLILFSDLTRADDILNEISGKVRDVYRQRHAAVVRVEATDAHGRLSGTGFYVDPSGTLYTLAAVVTGSNEITVCQGNRKMPAQLLAIDSRSGIALIKVNADTPFLPLGDSAQLEVATPVMSIGYPMDLPATPHFGLVAGFDRKFMGYYFCTTHVRANVPVQPGEGGSPILNLAGQVVGILVSGIDGGAACYFLPIAAAEKIRSDYIRFGKVKHGWVGVRVEEADTPVEGFSARIVELGPESPAALCGLRNGDIVTRVGNVPISTPEDILDASFFLSAGDMTRIQILRDGKELSVQVRSGEHPQSRIPGIHATLPEDSRIQQTFRLDE